MPEERTVLDHLLEGRDALQREVLRLSAAINELDSVLGRIGSTVARSEAPANMSATAGQSVTGSLDATLGTLTGSQPPVTAPTSAEPVNPSAEVEAPVTVASRPRAVRKAPARKASRPPRTGATAAQPPKSIRVHVLEMLQAENREFGLAEIIDRVHEAGIQAHDDAVRSITIKLMKDGRVERVGRGQYRLARRGSAARASAAVATAPRVTESAPEPPVARQAEPVNEPEPATETVSESVPASEIPTYAVPEAAAPEPAAPESAAPESAAAESAAPEPEPVEAQPAAAAEPEQVEAAEPEQAENVAPGPADPGFAQQPAEPAERSSYAPSLNLGQPWTR